MTNVEVAYAPRLNLDGPKKPERPMVVRFGHYAGHITITLDGWVRVETEGIGCTSAQTYDEAVHAWERRLGRR